MFDLDMVLKLLGTLASVFLLIAAYTNWLLGKFSKMEEKVDRVQKDFQEHLDEIQEDFSKDMQRLNSRLTATQQEMVTKSDLTPVVQSLARIDQRVDQVLILLQRKD